MGSENKPKLKDIATVIQGQSPKSKFYSESEGVPFLQGNRTFGNLYPTIDTYTTKVTKLAKKGEVLMSVRAPVGALNYASHDLCIGRGLASIKAKCGNHEFVYYALKYNIQNLIKQGAATTFDSVSRSTIENFELIIPKNEKDWVLVTSVLSKIDQKIELNNKINTELEAIAKDLYDYWFVQFDFPNANGKPYKSSGGKMVWNEELKREIPGAWKVMYLEKLLKTSVDKSVHIESKDIAEEGRYPVITQDVGDFIKGYTDENDPIMDIPLIIFGDHSCTLRYVDFPFFRGADGTQVMRFEDNLVIYAYLFLKSIISKIPNFGKYERHFKYIKEINILVPDKETLDKFQSITQPHFNKIKDCRLESEELANLRDWLLPMLMNGQVKVKNNED